LAWQEVVLDFEEADVFVAAPNQAAVDCLIEI
jgi:hypothetical protein